MRLEASARRLLAAGAVLFGVLYFLLARAGGGDLGGEILLMLPAALSAALLLRASREEGRARWFWRLLALGPGLWLAGEVLWILADYLGRAPTLPVDRDHGFALATDLFFISFLIPMIGAVGLRPHPRQRRRDPVALADTALVLIAITLVFLRVVFLPLRGMDPSSARRSLVLGALSFVLAAWTAGLWRRVQDTAWRRTYAAVSIFAFSYGTLSAVVNGMGYGMLPPGGPADIAWFVPFFVLAAAATKAPATAARRVPSAAIVLVAGPGPLVLDRVLAMALPRLGVQGALPPEPILLLAASALLAVACAARLLVEERLEQEMQARERAFSEEGRRAVRLGTLAALSAGLVEELERATDHVALRARAAAPWLGAKADRVVEQADRARTIVRELAWSLRVAPSGERPPVDVGRVLEETVRSVLDEGLPLRVSLEATSHLPEVLGDRGALGAAFLNVVRNAAQASPGGVLSISAATDGREVVVRFRDDGPGVPAGIRDRIFDPFFSTRRVGDGVGLGLTQAHFVARDHGGSIVLEPSREGACFAFRLPARERRAARPVPDAWPLSGAALLSAAAATTLALLPAGGPRASWSLVFQVGAAALAALALAGAGRPHRGRARWFWGLLAAGPGMWAITRVLRAFEGGVEGAPAHAVWHYVLYAVAELVWVAALLLRPDRKAHPRGRLRAILGTGAVLCLFVYLYTYLVVLPWPFSEGDAALDQRVTLVRGLQRVVALAAILALRELLAPRAAAATGETGTTEASPRLPGLVASAVYELGGELSGIAALSRLVLAQSDVPARVREDARRIRRHGDSALRIVNNVIAALRGVSGLPQMFSVNRAVREVIEERARDLAEESIRLRASLSDAVPPLTLNMTALRQAVLCCVDAAAVGLRAGGGGGTIEIVTALDENGAGGEREVVVGVEADRGRLPGSALRRLGATPLASRATAGELDASLGLAREIVSQLQGSLTGRNREPGGAELWIRLPLSLSAAPAAPAAPATRSPG